MPLRFRQGRIVATVAIVSGLVVLVTAVAALRQPLLQTWRRYRLHGIEEPYLRALGQGNESEKKAAAEKLGELRSERAIAPLIAALRAWGPKSISATGMVEIHFSTAALTAIGPPAITPLLETLRDDCEIVRLNASHALEKMGAPAVPALIKAFQNENLPRDARANAALGLGRIGLEAREAIPALRVALQSEDSHLKEAAKYALTRIVGDGPRE